MFYSILYPTKQLHKESSEIVEPDYFKDLNLNQIFEPILKKKEEFELEGFFYTSLQDKEVIIYRQDVMRELENDTLCALFTGFSKTIYDLGRNMISIRNSLTSDDSWKNNYLTRGHMLDYADKYCLAVSRFTEEISKLTLRSEGLCGFVKYIQTYSLSEDFIGLKSHVKRLREEFSKVEYCMLIKNGSIRVRKYEGQVDHSKQIIATFEKFRQGDVKDYRHKLLEEPAAAHVEVAVLNMLSGLYKDSFADLNNFCSKYINSMTIRFLGFLVKYSFSLHGLIISNH